MDLDDEEEEGVSVKEYTLRERTELRLECNGEADVFVQLLEGSAEIFGYELSLGTKVNVRGQKVPIFNWKGGCKLQVEGRPSMAYEAPDTPMSSYLDLHTRLNTQREAARAARKAADAAAAAAGGAGNEDAAAAAAAASPCLGPCVILVGPTDSGKSSLSRMLLNWAVRSGWEPTFVDLDVGQGTITAPGCVGAVPVEAPLDPEEGTGGLDMPLIMFYGHPAPADNPELYKFLIDRLAGVLERRAASNPLAAASGLIINTLGWVDGLGYELQVHAMTTFKADMVVVLDQDRLYSQLTAELKGRLVDGHPVEVLKLLKSGGVVKRDKDERRGARDRRLREYFYGPRGNLMPVTQTARADTLKVFRIGGGAKAPMSALPIGAVASAADPLRVSHQPVTAELVQSLLAVSHAETPDQLLSSNVAGFILIKEVDTLRGTVTYVAPCPGALPGRYLISGSLRSAMD